MNTKTNENVLQTILFPLNYEYYSTSMKKLLERSNYSDVLLKMNDFYLRKVFDNETYKEVINSILSLKNLDKSKIVEEFLNTYIQLVKHNYQRSHSSINSEITKFIEKKDDSIKIIWGDCLQILKLMKSESIHVMVTSPPYYNARNYSQWNNLNSYLNNMREIVRECYRVLDNHRVFVFNVGDIFDNDNIKTKAVWGKKRIPLGAYFTKIFEEEGFTFVDDFIWDKGEVQTQRHKNGNRPHPFYQYPANCYEHILIFHKHRLDKTRYPCPVCGSLKVNGNTQSAIGIQSWECKNFNCFERSKSNRGKRFSLKTIITQSRQTDQHIIDNTFIKKWRRDIIKFSPVIKINSKGENTIGHTAPFPKDIPELAIKAFSYKGEYVLDPFAGSFTSAIVAKESGRIGIGIEINKEMFRESILKNIKKNFNLEFAKVSEFNYAQ